MDLQEFLREGDRHFIPHLSIDLVVIGYQEGVLKCLLLRLGDKWLLPGGYVKREESVEDAVSRNLRERTALQDPHMQFLSVFGGKDREFHQEIALWFDKAGMPWDADYWVNQRFVTLAYYSLVEAAETFPSVGGFDEAFDWFSFDDLPEMWMDHRAIVEEARARLKEDIKQDLVTPNLLPREFTMPELHQLHQTILEEEIDRSRFQKKMLGTGRFERLLKRQKDSPGRNPYQYRLTR